MIKCSDSGVYLLQNSQIVPENDPCAAQLPPKEEATRGTIAFGILQAHNHSGQEGQLELKFDSLTSHDITYVGIIQTARASGMERFSLPYVLTNCHNSLCAVGGTINEDDHRFAQSAARKYGGIYVPTNLAVIHSYNREMMAGCGKMILGSDSHTRYGALGTLAVGEGGGELAKQLLGRTYSFARPEVVAVYLTGTPRPGVGPHDVALSIIGAVYESGYVKNKVMEFVGPGVAGLPIEYRNSIDVMTTETACWSSIWTTDERTEEYFALHGRPQDFKRLQPAEIAHYAGCITVDLSTIECSIALPMHPSHVVSIREMKENPGDILRETEKAANEQLPSNVRMNLTSKVDRDGSIWVDQGVIAGCAGGTYDNLVQTANILRGHSCGNGAFSLNVYPGSMPAYLELARNGSLADIAAAGAIVRECFCGPCFGAGDCPSNGAMSIRHTTRNFPNREGSKPGEGQLSAVALMDARSIAATAINGGRLTAADELAELDMSIPRYFFDGSVYEKRVYQGTGQPQPETELEFGPNIRDWPEFPALSDDLLIRVCSYITDPVTTTDELIPSGETSSYRSNPERLSEFALNRKDPAYAGRSKLVRQTDRELRTEGAVPEEVRPVFDALSRAGIAVQPTQTNFVSAIYAHMPGDGSAREQAASCQRVLGGGANLAVKYATKRYRSNCINWGILPFLTEAPEQFQLGDHLFLPGVRQRLLAGQEDFPAYVIREGSVQQTTLSTGPLTEEERRILAAGCLINAYTQ